MLIRHPIIIEEMTKKFKKSPDNYPEWSSYFSEPGETREEQEEEEPAV